LEEKPFKKETFDQKFYQYEHIKSPTTKRLLYIEIDKLTLTIPPDSTKWDKDVKDVVKRFADESLREIHNRALIDDWLTSARTLYDISDKETRIYFQDQLKEGVNKLYDKYHLRTRNVIMLMQMFSNFHHKVMVRLIDDSINKWNDYEFGLLHEKIDFESMRKVNPAFLKDIENSTLMKLDAARNDKKIRRLRRIYELVVSAQRV
jgi:hypothetical protein